MKPFDRPEDVPIGGDVLAYSAGKWKIARVVRRLKRWGRFMVEFASGRVVERGISAMGPVVRPEQPPMRPSGETWPQVYADLAAQVAAHVPLVQRGNWFIVEAASAPKRP